jgi:hypothetical protein
MCDGTIDSLRSTVCVHEPNITPSASITVPGDYIFARNNHDHNHNHNHNHNHTAIIIDTLKYNEQICRANGLNDNGLTGQIQGLKFFAVNCFRKRGALIFDPRGDVNVWDELVIDSQGDIVFGYVFNSRIQYINVSHLSKKYHFDFIGWEKKNDEQLNKYSMILGLARSQIIIRNNDSDIYVMPEVCINFINAMNPMYGKLLEQMVNMYDAVQQQMP